MSMSVYGTGIEVSLRKAKVTHWERSEGTDITEVIHETLPGRGQKELMLYQVYKHTTYTKRGWSVRTLCLGHGWQKTIERPNIEQ